MPAAISGGKMQVMSSAWLHVACLAHFRQGDQFSTPDHLAMQVLPTLQDSCSSSGHASAHADVRQGTAHE